MIKAILVIVVMPGYVTDGKETHIPFPSMEMCENALKNIRVENSIVFCTTPELETWYWPHHNPENKKGNAP